MADYFNLIIQWCLILSLSTVAFLLLRLRKSLSKERRLNKFSIYPLSEKNVAFFDVIEKKYEIIIYQMSRFLTKIKIFHKYATIYEKHIDQTKIIKQNSMDFISRKFIFAIATVIITIVSSTLRIQSISVLNLVLSFIIGFFILDIFLIIERKKQINRIENDLLKAVTIMNNAFKSGRSVMQAVELVYIELDGPISEEFRKMFIDLTYGLDLEVVFNRFSERVDLDEVKYMASSLVILNKTGGNVVKVFNSIEKGFFDRKKLNQELKSATALSELVFKVLVSMPILIFIIVYIFNPNYYVPLFTTTIGRIVLIIVLSIYITYILIVKRLVRMEE